MQDYLKGYLDVLPESERMKVSEVIKSNQEVMAISEFSEEEFERAIRELVQNHKQITEFLPQGEVLDSAKHNQFFSNLYMDLSLLFAESDMIEGALNNYHRLYDGILYDLNREVTALKQHINSLRLVNESEDGVIVKGFHFTNDAEMEIYQEGNRHLFTDRDGSEVPLVTVERQEGSNRIILDKTQINDVLRDKNGNVTAQIHIVDRRGTPVVHPGRNLYCI